MSTQAGTNKSPSLAVIGGGLAGIAAAESATRRGYRVTLFECSRVLGGRAASLFDPVAQQWIDNGQHLVLGCCSELLALQRRLELEPFFERYRTLPFAHANGKRWTLSPTPMLPGAFQWLPSLLKTPFLSFRERLQLLGQLRKLARTPPEHVGGSFVTWLTAHKTSPNAVEHFWMPLVLSALSDTPDHVCCQAVREVVRDGLMADQHGMTVYLPNRPLREIYHDAVLNRLRARGVNVRLQARVRRLEWENEAELPRIAALETADGVRHVFDAVILAVPAFRLWDILNVSQLEEFAEHLGLDRFEPGAITTLHLWFDQKLLPADRFHTTLLGGLGQFLACPINTTERNAQNFPHSFYHTVVVSAAHRLLADSELTAAGSAPLLNRVLQQLHSTFPASFSVTAPATLLHHRVTTYFDAVFLPSEAVFGHRPEPTTPFGNLALAGDWTQTHWPATMESAVRSGLAAVTALLENLARSGDP